MDTVEPVVEEQTFEAMTEGAIARYGPIDAEIASLRVAAASAPATLQIDDKAGYAVVHGARMSCVRVRAAIEKTRKVLKADAIEFGRRVDSAAKGWTEQIEAIEGPLERTQSAVEAEKARLAREAQERAAAEAKVKLDKRVAQVAAYGPLSVPVSFIAAMSDEDFATAIEETRLASEAAKAAKAKDDAERAARAAAEAAARAAQEVADREARAKEDELRRSEQAEFDRLKAKAREEQLANEKVQREAQAKLDAERAELDRQRAEIEADKARKAKAAAAKAEKARIAAIAPDVELVRALADEVDSIKVPLVWCSSSIEAIVKQAAADIRGLLPRGL